VLRGNERDSTRKNSLVCKLRGRETMGRKVAEVLLGDGQGKTTTKRQNGGVVVMIKAEMRETEAKIK
jgi:hypothetical protein